MVNLDTLWGKGGLRAFISHKAEDKEVAQEMKECLSYNGIASFVAHEDIEPTQHWQTEIERALFSMDILVALLTDEFSNSEWTDQEIGVAIGRGIFVIPISFGKDPYGFIGKIQAIRGVRKGSQQIADEIYEVVQKGDFVSPSLKRAVEDAREQAMESFVNNYIVRLARSGSFKRSNELAELLPRINRLSSKQEKALVQAFNENGQVRAAHGFSSIIQHLERMTGHSYGLVNYQLIELPF